MGKVKKAEPKSDLGFHPKGTPQGGQKVEVEGDDLVARIFNTKDKKEADILLAHCYNALSPKEVSDDYPGNDQRYFMPAMVADIRPRDAVERMLAVQMAATHVALIRSSRWLAGAETIPQVQAHYSGYNKLARTYAAQVEALRKHRNGGSQTVRVEHVTVEAGAQAVVGNVQTGG